MSITGFPRALRQYSLNVSFVFGIAMFYPNAIENADACAAINVFTAAHSIIIPIQCEYYALEGLSQLLNTIRLVQKRLNPKLEIEGILVTMYDGRLNLSKQVVDELEEYFENKVYSTYINRNVRLGEAPSHGKPILLYDASCIGAQNYMNLVSEILIKNEK